MSKEKNSYGSRFLYAEDLLIQGQFRSPKVTISEVHRPGTLKSGDGRMIDKWTIGFEGKDKLLALCKTNVSVLHFLTGYDAGEGWIGAEVTIGARVVKAFGADTTAIRVLPPKGTTLRKTIIDRLGTKAVFQGKMPTKQTGKTESFNVFDFLERIGNETDIAKIDDHVQDAEQAIKANNVQVDEARKFNKQLIAAASERAKDLSK